MKYNEAAFDMVPEKVRNIAKQVSDFLKSKGVPHAIIGGMAVSAYSPPRTTEDVDFLILESNSDVVYELDPSPTAVSGMYLQGIGAIVGGQKVDFMFLPDEIPEELLSVGPRIDGIQVLSADALILLKMKAGRTKDIGDVVEILKTDSDRSSFRKLLQKYAPDLIEDFDSIVMMADFESGKFGDVSGKGSQSRKAAIKFLSKKINK